MDLFVGQGSDSPLLVFQLRLLAAGLVLNVSGRRIKIRPQIPKVDRLAFIAK